MKTNIKKRCLLLISALLMSCAAFGQFDPQIGQYTYLPTAFNPAAVGEGDLMKISGLHRMQFTGYQHAPMTTYFCFHSPFEIGKTKHGAGIRFLNDRFGLYTNQTFHIQYAYRQKIGKGYLCIGTELGFVSVGFQGDSVNLDSLSGSKYHIAADDVIPKTKVAGMGFDMGIGLYYTAPNWWAGISYSHITQPSVEWKEYATIHIRGTMYASGGYKYKIRNHDISLQPSAMLMTDFASWDVNVTFLCEFKEKYRCGAGYRIGGNVALLLGLDIISGLTLGYTYELPTTKLIRTSYGSHEVYLAYGFNVLKPKRTNRYRSVRYL